MQQMLLVCKTPVQSEHGAPPCPARQRCSSLLAAVLPAAAQPCTCECIAGCTERLMTIPTHPPLQFSPLSAPPNGSSSASSLTLRPKGPHLTPNHPTFVVEGGLSSVPPSPLLALPAHTLINISSPKRTLFFFFSSFFLVYIIIFFPPAPLSPHISFWLSHFCRLCCDLGRGDTGRDVPLPPPPKEKMGEGKVWLRAKGNVQ